MAAWRNYLDAVRFKPVPGDEQAHEKRIIAKQTALIFSIMEALNLKLSESEIQAEAYISGGFVTRDSIYIASLQAMPEIAQAMKRSADAAEGMFGLVSGQKHSQGHIEG